jgi:hypothetical protein
MHTYNPVFKRVAVDCVIAGNTRISWELQPHFIDAGPYVFTVQVGHTGVDNADDWTIASPPVTDTYFTIDRSQRVFGKTQETHYRVKLVSSVATYYSEPEPCDGHLIKRDWIDAREIIRKELLRHRVLTSPEGYLLKARRYGPRCSVCTDQYTEEVSNSQCPSCYGTGFENGYFAALPSVFADLSLENNREHRVADKGMDKADVITARFIGDPQLYSYDVWINKTSDERYYLHNIKVLSHVRGVSIIYEAELRMAPFTDVIYTVPLTTPVCPSDLLTLGKPQWKPKKVGLNYLDAAVAELKARQKRTRS